MIYSNFPSRERCVELKNLGYPQILSNGYIDEDSTCYSDVELNDLQRATEWLDVFHAPSVMEMITILDQSKIAIRGDWHTSVSKIIGDNWNNVADILAERIIFFLKENTITIEEIKDFLAE